MLCTVTIRTHGTAGKNYSCVFKSYMDGMWTVHVSTRCLMLPSWFGGLGVGEKYLVMSERH